MGIRGESRISLAFVVTLGGVLATMACTHLSPDRTADNDTRLLSQNPCGAWVEANAAASEAEYTKDEAERVALLRARTKAILRVGAKVELPEEADPFRDYALVAPLALITSERIIRGSAPAPDASGPGAMAQTVRLGGCVRVLTEAKGPEFSASLNKAVFKPSEAMKVRVKCVEGCYVYLFVAGSDNNDTVTLMAPSESWPKNKLKADAVYTLPPEGTFWRASVAAVDRPVHEAFAVVVTDNKLLPQLYDAGIGLTLGKLLAGLDELANVRWSMRLLPYTVRQPSMLR